MKNYKRLQMEVITLNNEDVLTASGNGTGSNDKPNYVCPGPGEFGHITCELACKVDPNGCVCQSFQNND